MIFEDIIWYPALLGRITLVSINYTNTYLNKRHITPRDDTPPDICTCYVKYKILKTFPVICVAADQWTRDSSYASESLNT